MSHVRWSSPGGGEAAVTVLDGDRVTVHSTTASAPGSRPEGTLGNGARFWMKVARCRREGEHFVIEGRLLDATREMRAELKRLLEGGVSQP